MATKKAAGKKGGAKRGAAKGAAKKGGAKRGGKKGAGRSRDLGSIMSGIGSIASGIGSITGAGKRDLAVSVPRGADLRTITREVQRQLTLIGCGNCLSGKDRILIKELVSQR